MRGIRVRKPRTRIEMEKGNGWTNGRMVKASYSVAGPQKNVGRARKNQGQTDQ